jgi:hypothetical protein
MQIPDHDSVHEKYAEKSDDELLLLASEDEGLTVEAKRLLAAELAQRQLGQAERQEYGEHIAKAEEIEATRRSVLSFHYPLYWLLTSLFHKKIKKPLNSDAPVTD